MPALTMTLNEFASWVQARGEAIAHASLRQPLTACKVLLVAEARNCFDQGHAPSGSAWLPLKRLSAKRGGASAKPLRDTGLLMASVTAGGKGHVEELTDTSLTVGTNLDYAAAQQNGASIFFPERRRAKPWVFLAGGKKVFTRRIAAHTVTIPPRPFLGFSDRAISRIELIFSEWLERHAL